MIKAKLFLTVVLVIYLPGAPAQNNTRNWEKAVTTRKAEIPVVTFEYADLYDRFCSEVTKTRIDPAAVGEIQNRIDEFREAWRKEAPQLLETVVKMTRAPFDFRETKAALSLCNPGSLSFPLIIDVRKYSRSLNGEQVLPLDKFAATVFHETMHRYVNDRRARLPGRTTPLLGKYKDEPAPVRNHIHLFAIFDEAYRRLGRHKDLERLIALEQSLNSAAVFKRAREIIAAEGAESIICEISKDGCTTVAKP